MANEKRLVNAEAIARKLKYAHCTDCNVVRKIQCSACWVNDVLELLEGDSVDAVEVVHGHWISKGYKIECSVCEHRRFLGTHDPVIHREEKNICKYCQNCGAKMDGERKDND